MPYLCNLWIEAAVRGPRQRQNPSAPPSSPSSRRCPPPTPPCRGSTSALCRSPCPTRRRQQPLDVNPAASHCWDKRLLLCPSESFFKKNNKKEQKDLFPFSRLILVLSLIPSPGKLSQPLQQTLSILKCDIDDK